MGEREEGQSVARGGACWRGGRTSYAQDSMAGRWVVRIEE